MYYKKLIGDKVYLSPMAIENEVKIITKWFNEDEEIAANNGFIQSVISEDTTKTMLQSWSEGDCSLSIIKIENDEFIGHISLFNPKKYELGATMGIYINKENRFKGYGSEAIKLLLSYAFDELNYHFVRVEVFAYNQDAVKTYEKCGFKQVGKWRQSRYHHGVYHDIILMDIIKDEFI
ncbi:MAG: GNAT family protein [Erysipelotrichaceae bacterium]|nr:GNAT family protein [Erysipelotrichaceae bacterium]MDD3923698.1 GNAT family protein [Erysipelotrichaceae bacterium]MDD4642927.1 GNAT family protein [Erysipelotrichaceae bacterium]